jgi:hypothetical protein
MAGLSLAASLVEGEAKMPLLLYERLRNATYVELSSKNPERFAEHQI